MYGTMVHVGGALCMAQPRNSVWGGRVPILYGLMVMRGGDAVYMNILCKSMSSGLITT